MFLLVLKRSVAFISAVFTLTETDYLVFPGGSTPKHIACPVLFLWVSHTRDERRVLLYPRAELGSNSPGLTLRV